MDLHDPYHKTFKFNGYDVWYGGTSNPTDIEKKVDDASKKADDAKNAAGDAVSSSISIQVLGGTRNFVFDADENCETAVGKYSVKVLRCGEEITPMSYSWTCGGILTGTSTDTTFAPTVSGYTTEDSYIQISIIVGESSYTDKVPISVSLEGADAYEVFIYSTNGNIFKNGQISTILSAQIYKGDVDVTSTIDATRFVWTRVSDDTDGDTAWNQAHSAGRKSITITNEDVKNRATFDCTILDKNMK